MTDMGTHPRPTGLAILAILHVVGGSLAMLGTLALIAIGVMTSERTGVPAGQMFLVGLLGLLGPGLGSALLRGRPWSWYVVSFGYVSAAVVGSIVLPPAFREFEILGALGGAAFAVTVTQGIATALVALYLFSGPVADFFGISRRRRWLPLVADVVLAVGLFFGIQTLLAPSVSEPSNEADVLLQSMGDQRANSDEDVRFMLDHLKEGSAGERISAAWALGHSGRGDVIPQLLEASREDADDNVRINAIVAVGKLGGGEVEDDLIEFLGDRNPDVRSAALRAVASDRYPGAVEAVGKLMLEQEALRGTAVDALGNMGNVEALRFLEQVADDPEEDVRSRTAHAMGKLGDRAAVPILREMLADQRWTVRANAVQALGKLGDPSVRPALERMLEDPNTQVRATAEAALGRFP
jgi:hypothetical protein